MPPECATCENQRLVGGTAVIMLRKLLCLVAGLIWLGPALAHDKEEVLSLSVTNYTGYVIASDSQQGAP